jgi:amino acid transporter
MQEFKNRTNILLTVILIFFVLLIIPLVSFAEIPPASDWKGLVPCIDGKACDFGQLLLLVDNLVKFALYGMAIPIAAVSFAYTGFKIITAPGGEAVTKAKNVFTNTVLGLILAFAAFVIVKTVLAILGYTGTWIGF